MPCGYLFLSTAESADSAADLYASFSREQHIYQSKPIKSRYYPVPESVPALQVMHRPVTVPASPHTGSLKEERITFGELHQQMLEQYAPPSLVVNEEYEIVHLTRRAARYLQLDGGEPSRNLFTLVRQEMRLELRSALYQATQQGVPVEARGLKMVLDNHTETVNVHIRPVLEEGDVARGFILIVFEPATASTDSVARVVPADQPVARQLESELVRLKTQLRSSGEQHEFQAEELKASNEELQAMNEELRSAAEELETSKEELQSINEELSTVNQELKVKIEEASLMSNNLQNLINATHIGTIFLDRALRVALFTPSACDVFNLIPADRGRPLSDITSRLQDSRLAVDAEKVLENLVAIEREICADNGLVYLMRLSPYRTEEDRIRGVVITLVNITERKRNEEQIRMNEERFRLFVNASSEAIYSMNADWTQMHSLKGTGFMENTTMPSRDWLMHYIPKEDRPVVQAAIQKAIDNKKTFELEHHIIQANGSIGWAASRAVPLLNDAGEIKEWFGAASDITKRKSAEEDRDRFFGLSRDMLAIASTVTGMWIRVNPAMTELLGWSENELLAMPFLDIVHPDDRLRSAEATASLANGNNLAHFDHRVLCKDGGYKWVEWQTTPFAAQHAMYCFGRDITGRKQAEQILRESELRKSYLLQLSDASRHLSRPEQVQEAIANTALSFFSAGRCYYCEIENDKAIIHTDACREDLSTVSGIYALDSLPVLKATLQAGRTIVVEDAHTSPLLDEDNLRQLCIQLADISFIAVPVIKEGHPTGVLCIMQSVARIWSSFEVELAAETAERTWVAMERARSEDILRVNEERYRAALQSAEMGTWDWNISEDKTQWNAQHYLLLGLQPEDRTLNAAFFMQLIHPQDLPAVSSELNRAIETDGIYHMEAFRIIRADNGQVRWMTGYGRAVNREAGKASRMVGIIYDITERKLLEQQKEEFIGIASHELRTPVTSIKAYVEILEEIFTESGDGQNAALMHKLDG